MYHFIAFTIALCSITQTARADWPQFLGPDRNATVAGPEIARSWPDSGPRQLWDLELGEGFGGVSIHDGEVFILDRIEDEADVMRCFDLETGKERWNVVYDAPGKFQYPGTRSVPTVDDQHVWSVGSFGHLYCFSRKSKDILWTVNFIEELDGRISDFGVGQSPLIYQDLVIIMPQGESAGLAAYDKLTGELRWKTRGLTGRPWFSSPIIAHYGGVDQVIAISPYDKDNEGPENEVVAFDPNTGKELWVYKGLYSFATIASPKVIDDTRLFLTCGSYNDDYQPISIMLDIRHDGEDFVIKELFRNEEAGSKIHAAVRYGNYLYLNSGDRGENMTCISLEGETMWRGENFHLGGPILIGDLILNQNGKRGDVHLIQATPDGYTELGHAVFESKGKNTPWAPLAYSGGKLLVRHSFRLYCLDLINP